MAEIKDSFKSSEISERESARKEKLEREFARFALRDIKNENRERKK